MTRFLFKSKGFRWGLLSLLVLVLFAIPNPANAQEGVTGNVCVQDYRSGAGCTANDVRIEELTFVNLIEGCNQGTIGMLTAEFRMLISSKGSPNRYDIGVFVDLSGSPTGALTGDNCYHGYLSPPITTTPVYGDLNNDGIADIAGGSDNGWWNGEPGDPGDIEDTCGDIEANTQAFSFLVPLTLPCIDNSGNGGADVHVCTSWDNNGNTTCTNVSDAFPGTNSKCSCDNVELPFTPSQIELMALEANSSTVRDNSVPILAAFAGFGLILASGLIFRMRRGSTQ